jgi:dipeptidyl aminopeptidase/acylaminoacyl peptidase
MNHQLKKMLLVLILISFCSSLMAQATPPQKTVTLEEMKTWRNNSVTLSDDGKWYTVLYTLTEKPKADEKTTKEIATEPEEKGKEKKGEQIIEELSPFGKTEQTDVLYIHNASSGQVYEIPDGSRPLFSPCSEWIAYSIKSDEEKVDDKEAVKIIELRHLSSGKTRRWLSNATFSFAENEPYFLSSEKTDLLLYNLKTDKEHYIGNIGEFVLNKNSQFLLYSIASSDKRGNGIYIYDLQSRVTLCLDSENSLYGNLAWNRDQSAVSAIKFEKDKAGEPIDIRLITCQNIESATPLINEYASDEIKGMPAKMRLVVEAASNSKEPAWSQDKLSLFVRLKNIKPSEDNEDRPKSNPDEESSVDIWHWQDEKLISQQMMEASREANKTYQAIFIPASQTLIPLTGPDMQTLIWAPDTDRWAIGGDDRLHISDWDVAKRDLFRIDLQNGQRTPIIKKYAGRLNIAPGGERAILWNDGQYWSYEFKTNTLTCISEHAGVSFRNAEYDQFGADPDYGFVGWVKDQQSIIVNHKLDLWRLFIDQQTPAINLTAQAGGDNTIRFRFSDPGFSNKPEPEDRTIDLSKPHILKAFNILSKESGYSQLQGTELKSLTYKPAWHFSSGWRGSSDLIRAKNSTTVIYIQGNYQNYPEAYLSDTQFTTPRQITRTNPQEAGYKWGRRILINYINDDGVPLQGVLSIPDSYQTGQTLPMIVYTYEKLSQNLFRYPSMRISGSSVSEMIYVSDDYLFLQPDIHFNVGTPHTDMHESIDAAIREVVRLGYVDEKRIGYEGFSYGGHCGMYIATQENRFAAIAAGAGVSNLVQGFTLDIVSDGTNEQDYYMTQQGRLGVGPNANLEMYIRESALFQAHNMQTPLLLFHGTSDNVVQWEHSFGLFSILRYLKKPVIFLSYKGEGHGLRTLANRMDIQLRLKEYFDHYLKGQEASSWISEGIPYQPKIAKEGTKGKKETSKEMWK